MESLIGYEASQERADKINAAIVEILQTARSDRGLRARLEQEGVDLALLDQSSDPMFAASPGGQGFEPVSTGIFVVYAARFGYRVATDVWSRIILPRLEDQFGEGFLQGGTPAPDKPTAKKKKNRK